MSDLFSTWAIHRPRLSSTGSAADLAPARVPDIVLKAVIAVLPKTLSITILQRLASPRHQLLENHETS